MGLIIIVIVVLLLLIYGFFTEYWLVSALVTIGVVLVGIALHRQERERREEAERESWEKREKEELRKRAKELEKRAKEERISKMGLREIDIMDGLEFGQWCAWLLQQKGYSVKMTKGGNDRGADMIAQKDGHKFAVLCKRYMSHVNIKAVQEVIAAKHYYQCDRATIITNWYFSQNAMEMANAVDVLLIDRDKLIQMQPDWHDYHGHFNDNKAIDPLREITVLSQKDTALPEHIDISVNHMPDPIAGVQGVLAKTASDFLERYKNHSFYEVLLSDTGEYGLSETGFELMMKDMAVETARLQYRAAEIAGSEKAEKKQSNYERAKKRRDDMVSNLSKSKEKQPDSDLVSYWSPEMEKSFNAALNSQKRINQMQSDIDKAECEDRITEEEASILKDELYKSSNMGWLNDEHVDFSPKIQAILRKVFDV